MADVETALTANSDALASRNQLLQQAQITGSKSSILKASEMVASLQRVADDLLGRTCRGIFFEKVSVSITPAAQILTNTNHVAVVRGCGIIRRPGQHFCDAMCRKGASWGVHG